MPTIILQITLLVSVKGRRLYRRIYFLIIDNEKHYGILLSKTQALRYEAASPADSLSMFCVFFYFTPIIDAMYRPAESVDWWGVVSRGAPSLMRRVLLISLGMTILPKSSILRTIPVAFIISKSLFSTLKCAEKPYFMRVFGILGLLISYPSR